MSHTIKIDLPDEIYHPLSKTATQTGRTPEDIALEWIKNASQSVHNDPLENFIGSIKSSAPDWVDGHDKYIGSEQV